MAVSYSIIGRHIRLARKNSGYTQEDMSEMLKMTVAHYGRLERGERSINLERLSQISVLLKVPIEKLVEGCVPDGTYMISETQEETSFLEKMRLYMQFCSEDTLQRMVRVCDVLADEDRKIDK